MRLSFDEGNGFRTGIGEDTLGGRQSRLLPLAVDFDADQNLAAGELILVVKNQAAFEARYGTGFRIAGQYGVAYLFVYANTGTAPQVILSGDTAV